MKTFIALLLISNIALACPNNVQTIESGEKSPCKGWVVSPDTMQKMARTDEELEKTKKLVLAQEHLQKLSEAEIEFYKGRGKTLQKQLEKAETKQSLTGVGAFALGVVLTGIAAKAAIEATR
jgi:hypothetical protein